MSISAVKKNKKVSLLTLKPVETVDHGFHFTITLYNVHESFT